MADSYKEEDDEYLDLKPSVSELTENNEGTGGLMIGDNNTTVETSDVSNSNSNDDVDAASQDGQVAKQPVAVASPKGLLPPRPPQPPTSSGNSVSMMSVHSVTSVASAPTLMNGAPGSPIVDGGDDNSNAETGGSAEAATPPPSAGGDGDNKKKKKSPRKVLSAKLAKRFDKFESVDSDAKMLSPMQSLEDKIALKPFDSAKPPLASASPTSERGTMSTMSKTPKTTGPRRKRSVRKSLEGRVSQFDTGSTPFSKPRRMKSLVDRNCLLSPQEVKALIKQKRDSKKLEGDSSEPISLYEKTLKEQSLHLKELAARQAAKERQRQLGDYAHATFGGSDPANSEAGRKLAWQQTRARFGQTVSSKKKQKERNVSVVGFESSIHDTQDKEVAAAVKLEVHKNVQAVSYDFTSFEPPSNGPKTSVQRDLIVRVVETSFVFAEFKKYGKARVDGAVDALIEAFEVVKLPIGEILLHQDGNPDDNDMFYIVESGAVDFRKDDVTVGQAYVTDWFGEQALLHHQASKLTVTIAQAPDEKQEPTMAGATLLRMKQKTFRGLLHVYSNKAMEEKRVVLNGIDFLQGVIDEDEELVDKLASIMVREEFSMDETLYVPEVTTFLVVQSGQLKVKEAIKETVLNAGDYRGERSMLGGMRGKKALASKRLVMQSCSEGVYFHVDRFAMEEILGPSRLQNLKDVRRLALSDELLKKANVSKKAQGNIAKKMVEHTVKGESDEPPQQEAAIESPEPTKRVFEVKKSERPALYLVRQGSMRISYHDMLTGTNHEKEVLEGEVFGHEQLEERTIKGKTTFRRIGGLKAEVAPGCKASIGVVPIDALHDVDRRSIPRRGSSNASLPKESIRSIASISSSSSMASVFIRNKLRRAVEANVGLDDLKKIKMLGEGQFGEVWLVSADVFKTGDPERRQKFALKSQFKVDDNRGFGALDAIKREIQAIKDLDHPGIVNLVTTYEDKNSLYMLMGLVPGGELWDIIYKEDADGNWHNGIPENDAKYYAMILADTLGYIHSQKYVYRDFKPENIMIDPEGQPVLVDFGFAKLCPDPDMTYTFVGTPNYVAPEIITNAGHNRSVDCWAFGVTLYEMIEGENPFFFDGMSQVDLYDAICNEEHYPMQESRPSALVSLVSRLLEKDPTKRLGMLADGINDILRHPWFEGMDVEQLRTGEVPPPSKPAGESTTQGLEEMFLDEIGVVGADGVLFEDFEELDIAFADQSNDGIGLVHAPSLDDSFASMTSVDNSIASYPRSPEIIETTPQNLSKSTTSMSEVDRKNLVAASLAVGSPSPAERNSEDDLSSKATNKGKKSPRTTPRTKKKTISGSPLKDPKKKERVSMGPAPHVEYKASEFQFVKPETTYTPIRKLHKYDAEVSKIRRHNLKEKLRGMGIDSDDDDDVLLNFINSPAKSDRTLKGDKKSQN
mmetsp:Transcript_31324/g.75754  ORF Transcript_31324/g.75754 Transcript_31324/m.75754 type:complete len:1421 (-) Transcript_31324:82-4344(-)